MYIKLKNNIDSYINNTKSLKYIQKTAKIS